MPACKSTENMTKILTVRQGYKKVEYEPIKCRDEINRQWS